MQENSAYLNICEKKMIKNNDKIKGIYILFHLEYFFLNFLF